MVIMAPTLGQEYEEVRKREAGRDSEETLMSAFSNTNGCPSKTGTSDD